MIVNRVFIDWLPIDRESETTTSSWAVFPAWGVQSNPSSNTPEGKAEGKAPNKVFHGGEDERKSL